MNLTHRAARTAFRDIIRSGGVRRLRPFLPRPLRGQGGFTYLAALVLVIMVGISLSGAVQLWSMQMKREREEQLLYIMMQYRNALRRYYCLHRPPVTYTMPPPLNDLKDLTKDPGNAGTVRFLRASIYNMKDPMTGKEFDVVKDATGIVGIKSKSEAEPIKKANFPDEFADFEGKTKYSDWVLNCRSTPLTATSGNVSGLGGSTSPGSPTSGSPTPGLQPQGSPTPSNGYDNSGVQGWGAPATSGPPGVPGWGNAGAVGRMQPDGGPGNVQQVNPAPGNMMPPGGMAPPPSQP